MREAAIAKRITGDTPIGLCFPYALDYQRKHGGIIVHAIVNDPWDGHSFDHAWVEKGGKVYDWQNMEMRKAGPKTIAEFYETWKPKDVRKFDEEQAAIMAIREMHKGPWPKFVSLRKKATDLPHLEIPLYPIPMNREAIVERIAAEEGLMTTYDLFKALGGRGWRVGREKGKTKAVKRYGRVWVSVDDTHSSFIESVTISATPITTGLSFDEWQEVYKKTKLVETVSWMFNERGRIEDVERLAEELAKNAAAVSVGRRRDVSEFNWRGKVGDEGLLFWKQEVRGIILEILKNVEENYEEAVEISKKYGYPNKAHFWIDTRGLLMDVLNNHGMKPDGWRKEEAARRVVSILEGLVKAGEVERWNESGKITWYLKKKNVTAGVGLEPGGTSCRTRNEDMPGYFDGPAVVYTPSSEWPEARRTARVAGSHSVEELIRPYEGLQLECDGMTRVVTYLLKQAGIRHKVMLGKISVEGKGEFAPHYWVELPSGDVVDYKSRMWFGNDRKIPQGVFRPEGTVVSYDGRPVSLPVNDMVFKILTMNRVGCIAERVATRTRYKKVEQTSPGSKLHYKVTYHDGQEKWVDSKPGRGEGGKRNTRVMKKNLSKPSVQDALKTLDKAMTKFENGADEKVLQKAVEHNEVHLDRTNSKKVNRLFMRTVKKQEGEDIGDKTKEGLGVIKDHINRDRRDANMSRESKIAGVVVASEVVNEMARQISHFTTSHETALSKVFGGRWTSFKPFMKEDNETIVAKFIQRGFQGAPDSMAGFRLKYDYGSDTYVFTPFSSIKMMPVKWGRSSEDFYVEDLGDVSKLTYLYQTAK